MRKHRITAQISITGLLLLSLVACLVPEAVTLDATVRDAAALDVTSQDRTASDQVYSDQFSPHNDANDDAAVHHDASAADTAAYDSSATDQGGDTDAGQPCPVNPCTVINVFPFVHSDDSSSSPLNSMDSYSCAPSIGEAGPEQVYQLNLSQSGILIAMLDDGEDHGADIDIHLLIELDSQTCLRRGHKGLSAHLDPGRYYLVADSYSTGSGTVLDGPYTLYVHFIPDGSSCAMLSAPIVRIGASEELPMPATGPVVKEAHLVTDQEFTDNSWPQSVTDGITAHYALSASVTGYAMSRTEPWAPCCEPSNEYGQGSSVRPPVEAEAFYINMRWSQAPSRGQRYIVYNGITGRAVVAAAGYENGPGDLSNIGGASEEIHDYLETGHLSHFTFGVAANQNLSYGPIDCGY